MTTKQKKREWWFFGINLVIFVIVFGCVAREDFFADWIRKWAERPQVRHEATQEDWERLRQGSERSRQQEAENARELEQWQREQGQED